MSVMSAALGTGGGFTAGLPSFTELVFTVNRLFCRYWPPTPAAAAIAAAVPLATRNLRRLVLGGGAGGLVRGMSVRVMLPIQSGSEDAARQQRRLPG